MAASSTLCFEALPVETLFHILAHVGAKELGRLAQSSSHVREVADSNYLWGVVAAKHFPFAFATAVRDGNPHEWKNEFMSLEIQENDQVLLEYLNFAEPELEDRNIICRKESTHSTSLDNVLPAQWISFTQLILLLSGRSRIGSEFIRTVIYTHPKFCASETLLQAMLLCLKFIRKSQTLATGRQIPISIAILVWIQSACWAPDERLDATLTAVVEELEFSVLALKLQRELYKHTEKRAAVYKIEFPAKEKAREAALTPADLRVFPAQTLAQQLFLVEFSLWRNIHPHEFLNRAWRFNRRAAPNLCKALAWSESVQKAIKGDLADDPFDSLLAKTHFWLDIAEESADMSNFQAVAEIVFGLESAQKWRTVSENVDVSARVRDLKTELGIYEGHDFVADQLHCHFPLAIPYLAPWLTFLENLESQQEDFLTTGEGEVLINLVKMHSLFKAVDEIVQYQKWDGLVFARLPDVEEKLVAVVSARA